MSEAEERGAPTVDESLKNTSSPEAEVDVEEELQEEAQVESEAEELNRRIEELEKQAAEYLDGWQRSRAEFANARKRLERERTETFRNASVKFVSSFLPILDDFDRALSNVPPEIADHSWFEGLILVRRKMAAVLEELKVEPIEAVGQPFDPALHEALALRKADGVESGLVIEEVQTGYKLGDRVIRPSLVNVAE